MKPARFIFDNCTYHSVDLFFFQWLALRFPKAAIYLDSLRECYEAYLIYNFMTFLLAYLTAEYDFEVVLSGKHQVQHFFPCCSLPPWRMGKYACIYFLYSVNGCLSFSQKLWTFQLKVKRKWIFFLSFVFFFHLLWNCRNFLTICKSFTFQSLFS